MSSTTKSGGLKLSPLVLPRINIRSKEARKTPARRMSPRSVLDFGEGDFLKPDLHKERTTKRGILKVPIAAGSFFGHGEMHAVSGHTEAMTTESISIIEEEDFDFQDDDNHQAFDFESSFHFTNDMDIDDDENMSSASPRVPNAPTRKGRRKEQRKKIKWSGHVRVQEIRHLNNIPEFEKDAVWMSPDDYKLIKSVAKATVYMMMKGQRISDDDPDYCTRGLEFRTRSGARIRNENKLRARSAVLNEQDLQREEGFFDPQFIAMASMDESFECREAARSRAKGDFHSIRSYMADVRHDTRDFFL